jgi:hypothetical protein
MRIVALAVVGLLIAAAVGWDASGVHLKNCRQAAFVQAGREPLPAPKYDMDDPYLERGGRLYEGCSRLPW